MLKKDVRGLGEQLVILSFNLYIGKFERVVIPLPVDIEIGFQNKTLANIKGCLHLVILNRRRGPFFQEGFHVGSEIDV